MGKENLVRLAEMEVAPAALIRQAILGASAMAKPFPGAAQAFFVALGFDRAT
jgi:hypothetical protein